MCQCCDRATLTSELVCKIKCCFLMLVCQNTYIYYMSCHCLNNFKPPCHEAAVRAEACSPNVVEHLQCLVCFTFLLLYTAGTAHIHTPCLSLINSYVCLFKMKHWHSLALKRGWFKAVWVALWQLLTKCVMQKKKSFLSFRLASMLCGLWTSRCKDEHRNGFPRLLTVLTHF